MIEPTETESRETLERFAAVLKLIAAEAPEFLHDAPHSTPVRRPDEVAAARNLILKWTPEHAQAGVEASAASRSRQSETAPLTSTRPA